MVQYKDFGNPTDYPSLTEARNINTQIFDAIDKKGVPATADYLISTYGEDDAPLFAVAASLVQPGDFTINPNQPQVLGGSAFELFAHVVNKIGVVVVCDGIPVTLPEPSESMGGDPDAFLEAIAAGAGGQHVASVSAANQPYEPVWLRYVCLLQIYLLMDYTKTREAALARLEFVDESFPQDGCVVSRNGKDITK